MRLLTLSTPVSVGRAAPVPAGGFLAPEGRARNARHPSWTEFTSATGTATITGDPSRSMTTDQLFQVYRRTPDVRSAVDSIARRVATTDWTVRPVEGAIDPEDKRAAEEAMAACRDANRWFRAPMKLKTWQQWLTMSVHDLLLYDAMTWEKVRGAKGKLEELNVSRGDDWWPVVDRNGATQRMEQRINGQTTSFAVEDVVYLNLFPNTTTPRGMPLIETIVTEVIAILRGSERAMLTLDASEIPPGILYLTGIAGKAAEDTVQSFVNDKGRDHKMRVLHFPNPSAGSAEWLRLDHTPKEIGMAEVIEAIRRTIWRIFGVFPVEMGATDGMPRATAEVQMDAAASHLLTPILELLQEVITTQILPLVVDEKWAGILEFSFDYTRDLTPDEEKTLAEKDCALVDRGILSRNEVRGTRGLDPVENGEVHTVAGAVVSLESVVNPPAPAPAPKPPGFGGDEDDEDPDPDPEDPDGGEEAPGESDGEGDGAGDGDAAPGEAEESKGVKGPLQQRAEGSCTGCGSEPGVNIDCRICQITAGSIAERYEPACGPECSHRGLPDPDSLPSDWQPAGRFRGKRTLDLVDLGGVVSRYETTVQPLYEGAMDGFIAQVRAAYGDEKITTQEAARLAGDLDHAIHKLAASWEVETTPLYVEAAEVGDQGCLKYTGGKGTRTPEERATAYSSLAMGYLVGSDGPLEDVRRRCLAILGAVGRSRVLASRAAVTVPEDVEPGMPMEALLSAIAHAWTRNEHRIANWSGKLVELGNAAMVEGMAEVNLDKETGEPADWMVEWVSVGDEEMCRTCRDLGSQGFVELRTLPTTPGGKVDCRARDRCVLVYWTKAEVSNGTAAFLGGGNTGRPL